MKRTRWLSLLLASVLLVAMLCGVLVSCDTDSGAVLPFAGNSGSGSDSESTYVTGISVENGSIIASYSDGSRVNLGSSVTNVTNNENYYTIDSSKEDATSVAASRALLSTVQVICNFTKTVTVRGWGGYYTQDVAYTSAGSGVIYQLDKTHGDAYIITNQHVVYDSESNTSNHVSNDIGVYLYGSASAIPATYVGGSANYDIAVLKVSGSAALRVSAAEAATVSDSGTATVGSTALVVGNPEGAGISATLGVVSVDSEYITMTAVDNSGDVKFRVIRVDAAVNSGNSGGGLYNSRGELIGIVNAKVNSTSVENIGYAIPSNVAVAIAQNIIDNGAGVVRRAILGINIDGSDSHMVFDKTTGLTTIAETVKVQSVESGKLGEEIGLVAGDILVSVQVGDRAELTITRQYQVVDELLNARVGDTVTITIERGGARQVKTVTITEGILENY